MISRSSRTGLPEGESITRGAFVFESHAVAVMPTVAECARSWAELATLGVAEHDLGLVVGDAVVEATGDGGFAIARSIGADAGPVSEAMLRRAGRFEALPPAEDGARLFASCGYPADTLASGKDGAGRSTAFEGLAPSRDGLSLSAAIVRGGAALWARTRSPETASQVVTLLLRRSTERVRMFTRTAPESSGAET